MNAILISMIGAVCLLTIRAPAFGLALLAPLMAVIVLFRAILNPGGLPLAVVLIVCGALLVYANTNRFRPLFESGNAKR